MVQMVWDGPNRSKKVQTDPGWSMMVHDGTVWSGMVRLVQRGLGWSRNVFMVQVGPNNTKKF